MAIYKSSQFQREIHHINKQKEKLIITKEKNISLEYVIK